MKHELNPEERDEFINLVKIILLIVIVITAFIKTAHWICIISTIVWILLFFLDHFPNQGNKHKTT